MVRNLILAFIRLHLLYHAARAPIFGLDMLRALEANGYEVSPGTLYPLLHTLTHEGYLTVSTRVVGGKVRKYYQATPAGMLALDEARARAHQLLSAIDPAAVSAAPVQMVSDGE